MTDEIRQDLDRRESDYKKYLAWKSKLALLGIRFSVDDSNANYIILKSFTTPSEIITLPEGIHAIKSDAFEYCENVKQLVLPNSLLEISGWEELPSSITKCNLPPRLKNIHSRTFSSREEPNIRIDIQGDITLDSISILYKNIWLNTNGHKVVLGRRFAPRTHVRGLLDMRNGKICEEALKDCEVDKLVLSTDTILEEDALLRTIITKMIIECKSKEEIEQCKSAGHPFIEQLNNASRGLKLRTKTRFIVAGEKIK